MGTDQAASTVRRITVEAFVGLDPAACVTRQSEQSRLSLIPPSYFENLKFAR